MTTCLFYLSHHKVCTRGGQLFIVWHSCQLMLLELSPEELTILDQSNILRLIYLSEDNCFHSFGFNLEQLT